MISFPVVLAAASVAMAPVVEKSGWDFDRSSFRESSADVAAIKEKNRGLTVTGWAEYDFSVPKSGWYGLYAGGSPAGWPRDVAIDGQTIMRLGISREPEDVADALYKELNVFLEKGSHTLRYRRVGFPGCLPSRWELRPSEGPGETIRVGVKGTRLAAPGGRVVLEVLGGAPSPTSYELFLHNELTDKTEPVGKVEFAATDKPVTKEVVVTLPEEGVYEVTAKAGEKQLRFSDLKAGLLLCAKDAGPAPITGDDFQFASLFRDGAVLQRDMPLPVWGWAKPGSKVSVTLASQSRDAVTDERGKWKVIFDPIKTGEPYVLKATCEGKELTAKDLLAGEVWVLSGQSNMGGPLLTCIGGEEAAKAANFPDVRATGIQPARTADEEQRLSRAWWSPAVSGGDPRRLASWVGIEFGFGTDLNKALGVPVGMILANRGGTFISTWVSMKTQKSDPAFRAILDTDARDRAENIPELLTIGKADAEIRKWRKASAEAVASGQPTPTPPRLSRDTAQANFPAKNYDELIEPISSYAIRGVLWYQGESDSTMAEMYAKRFAAWMKDWRDLWQQPDLPILFVQIAYGSGQLYQKEPGTSFEAELKDVQRKAAMADKHTALVVTNDLMRPDDNVHYLDKIPLGRRLALAALATVYGKDVEFSGPLYDKMKIEGAKIRLSFTHSKGLAAKGEKLGGFAIAGADRKWVWADVKIEGETVVVSSEKVPEPVAVRYSWAETPSGGNLVNAAGLPAAVFRTDDWPGTTAGIEWVDKF